MAFAARNILAQRLAALHKPGAPLVLANVWDGISAAALLETPATAAATASFAVAAALGLGDDDLSLSQNVAAISVVTRVLADRIPLSADLQDGYGPNLAEAVSSAIAAGAVGCNLEDVHPHSTTLYPIPEMIQRLKTVRDTAASLGVPDFVINARTDTLRVGRSVEEAVERGKAYLGAGANTVFPWGGRARSLTEEEVTRFVKEFDGRVSVILGNVGGEALTTRRLSELGIARISVGPALMRIGVENFKKVATGLISGGGL